MTELTTGYLQMNGRVKYILHTCYVRVVKFLEKVIIKWNTDLEYPFKSKKNPETLIHEKSNICWKDPPCQNPSW